MTTLSGNEMRIKLGDGADPEVFTAPCGLNTRGFDRSAETNSYAVEDCANPDAPEWVKRVVRSFSSVINGAGHMHIESFPAWEDFFSSGESKNIQVEVGTFGTWQGAFTCNQLTLNGGKDEAVVGIEVSLENDGPVTKVA